MRLDHLLSGKTLLKIERPHLSVVGTSQGLALIEAIREGRGIGMGL